MFQYCKITVCYVYSASETNPDSRLHLHSYHPALVHITYLILLKYTELSKVQPVSSANTYVIFWSFEKVALKAKAVKVSYPKKIQRPKIEHQTYLSVCLRAFLDQLEIDVKKY